MGDHSWILHPSWLGASRTAQPRNPWCWQLKKPMCAGRSHTCTASGRRNFWPWGKDWFHLVTTKNKIWESANIPFNPIHIPSWRLHHVYSKNTHCILLYPHGASIYSYNGYESSSLLGWASSLKSWSGWWEIEHKYFRKTTPGNFT